MSDETCRYASLQCMTNTTPLHSSMKLQLILSDAKTLHTRTHELFRVIRRISV
jgi:hypothetical protein